MILCIKLNRLILNLFAYPPGARSAGFLYKLDNSSLETSKMLVIEHPSARWDKICSLIEKNQNSDVFNFCNCTILKRNLTTKRENTGKIVR